MRFYTLKPEVAGGLGDDTIINTTVHPPAVKKLHYEIDNWQGDDLLESFPCFIGTQRLRVATESAELTGVAFANVLVTMTDAFKELHQNKPLPRFWWLRITGRPGRDDLGLAADCRLVVSDRTIAVLEKLSLKHCSIEPLGTA